MKDFKAKTSKVKEGSWTIFLELCKGCGICLEKCPQKALIFGKDKGIYSTSAAQVIAEKCTLCGICEMSCPDCAIRIDKQNA